MIFPNVSLKDWLKKYPELKVISSQCENCGKKMKTTRPFIEKHFAGLRIDTCPCGKNRHSSMTMVTITAEKHQEWADLLLEFKKSIS
jgi:hypothetical protein